MTAITRHRLVGAAIVLLLLVAAISSAIFWHRHNVAPPTTALSDASLSSQRASAGAKQVTRPGPQ